MALIRKYFALGMAISVALGAFFAFLGVYDTNALPFYKRFVFWTATMITGSLATAITAPWALKSSLARHGPVMPILVVAALNAIPVTFVITLFNSSFSLSSPFTVWVEQYVYVYIIALVIAAGGYICLAAMGLIGARQNAEQDILDAHSISPQQKAAQKFMTRLPGKYAHAELYAVSSEDHYLRVHTSLGEELILMRLSDAMRELEDAGLQTHRSWWVATDGVAEMKSDNGKKKYFVSIALVLKSGKEAPVSRSFAKAVKEAGLG